MKNSQIVLTTVLISLIAASAMADRYNWQGDGDWTTDSSNWDTLPPVDSLNNTANIRSGTVGIDTENTAIAHLFLGHGSPSGNATLNMTGGSLTTNAAFDGYAANSTDIVINLSGNADMSIGNNFNMLYYGGTKSVSGNKPFASSTSTLIMSGNATLYVGVNFVHGARWANETFGNEFHVQMNGGVLTAKGYTVYQSGAGKRTLDLAGGAIRIPAHAPAFIDSQITVTGYGMNPVAGASVGGAGVGITYNVERDGYYNIFTGIPEPATLFVMLAAGLGMLRHRRLVRRSPKGEDGSRG